MRSFHALLFLSVLLVSAVSEEPPAGEENDGNDPNDPLPKSSRTPPEEEHSKEDLAKYVQHVSDVYCASMVHVMDTLNMITPEETNVHIVSNHWFDHQPEHAIWRECELHFAKNKKQKGDINILNMGPHVEEPDKANRDAAYQNVEHGSIKVRHVRGWYANANMHDKVPEHWQKPKVVFFFNQTALECMNIPAIAELLAIRPSPVLVFMTDDYDHCQTSMMHLTKRRADVPEEDWLFNPILHDRCMQTIEDDEERLSFHHGWDQKAYTMRHEGEMDPAARVVQPPTLNSAWPHGKEPDHVEPVKGIQKWCAIRAPTGKHDLKPWDTDAHYAHKYEEPESIFSGDL